MKNFLFLALTLALASAACRNTPAEPAAETDESETATTSAVSVSAEAQKAAGIKTATLRRAAAPETFTALGRILQDSQAPCHVYAGTAGRLAAMSAPLGQPVKEGATIASVKLPSGETRPVLAPRGGIVTAVQAAVGEQVNELSFLCSITAVDPIAAVLDIPERSLSRVKAGQSVSIKTAAYPGETFRGTITFVSPEIDPESRTVKAGVAIANPTGRLKFGMFIDAAVNTGVYFTGLAVPSDAVQTGPQGPFVFVKNSPTEFAARPVALGRENNGLTEITGGLRAGEQVAVEGSFLLKSELMKDQMGED